ncbi:enolase C-terminal domain-like protein [Fluviibacterium sp. DFM31]|uniref:glucarate dehydratase n=1 Tax=Meridianimarinicoccus marinus TaxID=3231483 RepID=A0ABV3L5Q6_9RHOB
MCGDDLENGLATPADYALYADWLVNERGYKAVKLHGWMPPVPGAPDVRKDYAACAAVREAVGPDMPLMLDPHHFYSRTESMWLADKLAELDFAWIEECMEEASMSSYQWLTKGSKLNILGLESMTGEHWTRAEWVRNGAWDLVRTGVWDVVGITPSMKISNMAESFHMSCEVHGHGAGNLEVSLAISNRTCAERGLLRPFLDYEKPKEYQNRIDDEMDKDSYVHALDTLGLLPQLEGLIQYLKVPTVGIEGNARVEAATELSLATNMYVIQASHLPPNLAQDAFRVVLSDHHYWGGLKASRDLARICVIWGVGLSMHSNSHLGISLAAATPNLTYDCATHYPWQVDEVIKGGRLRFERGSLAVPDGPGLGVTLDRAALARLYQAWLDTGIRKRDDIFEMKKQQPDWEFGRPKF